MDNEPSTRLVKAGVAGKPNPVDLLLKEPRMLASLLRWILRRHQANAPGHLAYHSAKQLLVFTFLALCALEGIGTHLVLLAIFGSRWWVWTIFALDMYSLVWLLGLYAAMIVLPHRIEADVLRLRYTYLAELVVPLAAVRGARAVTGGQTKNGKLMVDGTGRGVFCAGETSVAIDLDPEFPLYQDGLRVTDPVTTLHVTADAPRAFVDQLISSTMPATTMKAAVKP
jgi:hypothetical protein